MSARGTVRARTRALDQLLEAEPLAEAQVERLASELGAPGRIMVAVAYAKRGRLRSARAAVEQALGLAPEDAVVIAAAGMVSFVTRDYQLSLERLERAVSKHSGPALRWLTMARDFAARLGWDLEELAALEALCRVESAAPKAHLSTAQLHARRLNWPEALRHVDAALAALPEVATLHMERARLLVELGRRDEALASVARACVFAGESYAFQMEAGLVARRAGGFPAAEAHFERAEALALEQQGALEQGVRLQLEPRFARAEMAAWRGDLDRAANEAEACLVKDPSFASALRLLGAVAYCRGEIDEAERRLLQALALDPKESEARAWLAEIYIGRKDYEAADKQLYSAVADATGYSFPAALLRLWFSFQEQGDKVALAALQEVLAPLSAMDPSYEPVLRAGDAAACLGVTRAALARLGCNRSTVPTEVLGGELRALPPVTGLRYRSRVALQRLRVVGAEEVARTLRELAAEEPELALALCHLGELELWMGDYEAARRTLRATLAIQRRTRWAWIGLTLIAALLGDPKEGLRLSAEGIEAMGNTIGPAVYAHRGDVQRMAGNLTEAVRDLERSLEMHPRRVAARISYGLVQVALGDERRAREAFEQVQRAAPGLVSDAARELGVVVWGDPEDELALEVVASVLERALVLLRGNRSASSITYVTSDGRLRGCDFGQESSGLHSGDAAALYEARRLALALLDRQGAA
ncbi:MAG: tetratricopeptide repeat protein [Polyangiaceae bacterium]|nr:tetratricopeptide repeat protein [Polyangiaceae bacterium]MCW5789682.1 tetratricopeptide repeat protein [Polyangiaceae bacterium]